MKQEVLRIFLAALGFGLYLGLPGVGLPRAEAAIAALDRTTPRAEDGEEAGSDDSGGEENEGDGEGEESEEDSD
jgi:hypothetical protein